VPESTSDPWQDVISPDRPGAANPTSVVSPGDFQLETAFESANSRMSVTTLDFPTLLRLGVARTAELRLESDAFSVERVEGIPGSTSGFADLSVEAKWLLHAANGGVVPALALLPAVSLPAGSTEFSAGHAQLTLSGLCDWTLPGGTSVSLNADGSRAIDASDDPVWALSSEGGFEVPLQRHWAVSGDVFVSDARTSDATAEWSADAAVEFYPSPDAQLDLVVAHTLSAPQRASAVQVGYSRRWAGLMKR
jgi:hypothetical protein